MNKRDMHEAIERARKLALEAMAFVQSLVAESERAAVGRSVPGVTAEEQKVSRREAGGGLNTLLIPDVQPVNYRLVSVSTCSTVAKSRYPVVIERAARVA